ncbi:MAG: mercury(II) reductase [Candidatus Nitrosotalea sp.]|nr:mercury(II) reductase [Candidatus Nitrosotalea sp.]
MVETSYDLVILGGGAAAFASALKASEIDAKVAMIERDTIGGTCVNVGCVPSKNLLNIGELIHDCLNKKLDGQSFQSMKFDFKKIIQDKDNLVLNLRNQKYADVLKSMPNMEFIQGNAKFRSRNEIDVNGKILKAKNILIATGSSAAVPQIKGIDKVDYFTNIEALSLEEKPDSMIIIGGRVLGLEFAQMYSRLGTKVTLLQRSDRILPEEEPEISDSVRSYLEEEGIEIHTGVKIQSVGNDGEEKVVLASGLEFRAKKLLMATGRRPNTADLALENAGILTSESGAIVVDDEMRTNIPNIFAAGDIIGEPMLETVAAKEGSIAASNALFGTNKKMDFSAVPHAVFTSPQVASVGITEKEAVERYGKCSCKTLLMADVPKALVVNKTKGLIKMVVEPQTNRIIGVHILSDLAADIIHEAVLAVKHKLTVDDIIDTVHVFPTMSESIKLVATSFRKNVKQLSCCAE